ncbi:MAG: hypothetical protein JNM52_11020 [Betaproteobacteria bacterium]|nr:hypothetical protein [Betaproteobacteria bacterium]
MGKLLREFWRGMGSVLVISPNRQYIENSGGFAADNKMLRDDANRVARGLRKNVLSYKYGKSADYR